MSHESLTLEILQTPSNLLSINMDLATTTIGNRRGGASGNISKERQLNMARRQGAAVSTDSKYGAGGNRQGGTSLNTAKLDGETEELKHKTVDLSVGKLIAQGDFMIQLELPDSNNFMLRETGQRDVSEGSRNQDL